MYARICVEVPIEQPLTSHVFIGTHRQQILYEGINMLCLHCGRLGHTTRTCTIVHQTTTPTQILPL